jgi:catechol 2,3-dioxygenase-like lactoylglutathione lyase family enzyme
VTARGGMGQNAGVLLAGINHIGMLTSDTERLVAFYGEVFGATVDGVMEEPGELRLTLVKIGEDAELNVFEIPGNTEAERQVPMFGRGRLDHIGFQAASLEAFDEIRDKLIERGATDGFVTDFGHVLSLFFRDPDGLEAEVCVGNPDAVPGQINPPGTPSRRYHPAD